ncbi:SusC/RagA family TonB-linked outer membrane protein [Mariniflexile sp. AS56]|uniref:SusC/RagA family TonB-linked outer membrane protein n=1 Tax=Mariniflexile sp. AS56 TaxID=3063957 RepID=UPI0026EE870B|nr:SusC/RagA family TonB-linked outer membrane protein [Mariniflexile sp. AS56]MDO7172506.1 SusC/RagA family TonB-linked outer membrane protein [Mariniflexile sp. AS56]
MTKTKTLYLVLVAISLMLPFSGKAQEVNILNDITAAITNRSGDKLSGVLVSATKAKNTAVSNIDGTFTVQAQDKDVLIITSLGYEKMVVYVKQGRLENETIVLKEWGVINPEENINIALRSLPFERITGSVERITGDELSDFPTRSVHEALAGRLSGVSTSYGSTETVTENFGNNIRNQGGLQIYVDGIPTGEIVLTPSEVDDVIIAKDYGSSFMYGTLGATGGIIVNSKHGAPAGQSLKFKSRSGVRTSGFLPSLMNAQDYATNYNIALTNDGFSPIYSENDINDYKTGANPIKNPNNDYYKDFVNGIANYNHITGDFSGGSETVQYFSHLGYYGTDGIESVGAGRSVSRLRLNNNVQIKFSDAGNVNIGIGGSFTKRKVPTLTSDALFSTMSSYPANALPYKINDSIYGRTSEYGTNLLARLDDNAPVTEDSRRDAFARIGLDLNLDDLTEGLSFKSLVGMYTFNVISKTRNYSVNMAQPVFTLNNDGSYTTTYRNYSSGNTSATWGKAGDRVDRTQFINANLHYDRDFSEDHKVIADLVYSNQKLTGNNLNQSTIFRNIGLTVNYLFKNKYVLEGKVLNSPIRQLSQDERSKINYDGGAAWLMHKEDFLSHATWLNFLKLRGNFGVQSRPVSQFFISENLYGGSGGGTFGTRNQNSGAGGANRIFTGSSLVSPKQEYLSLGADFQMFNSKVNGQINYFNIRNYDQVVVPTNLYALIPTSYVELENYGDSRLRGMDGSISYKSKVGEVSYRLGINATYSLSYDTESNSVIYPEAEAQRNSMGNNGGRILGLQAVGIFQNEAEIAAAAPQLFGEVKPGDIRYSDYNRDGFIDERDYHEIGNSSRVFYGVNYFMSYKDWSFSIHGNGELGGSYVENLNWSPGTNNYTNSLSQSWPVTNSLPRLTTLDNTNNYRNSSFWLKNAGYFNFRSVMVSFALPDTFLKNVGIEELKFSASGKNLFIISSNNDDRFMPNRSAGYTQAPVLKAFELGMEVTF